MRLKSATVIPLFGFSRACSCAVSSPTATSRLGSLEEVAETGTASRAKTGALDDDPARIRDEQSAICREIRRAERPRGGRSSQRCRASRDRQPGRRSSAHRICSGIAQGRVERVERVLPEIAHRAAVRALRVREEDRRDGTVSPGRTGSSSTKKPYGRAGRARSSEAAGRPGAAPARHVRPETGRPRPARRSRRSREGLEKRAAVMGLAVRKAAGMDGRPPGAVLKAALREDGHRETGDRVHAARDDLALQGVEPLDVPRVRSANGIPSATSMTRGRVNGLSPVKPDFRSGAYVRAYHGSGRRSRSANA